MGRYHRAQSALRDIQDFFAKNYQESTDEHNNGSYNYQKKLYSFQVGEYKDGSGINIDLTGVGISIDVMNFVRISLEQTIKKIEEEIVTL